MEAGKELTERQREVVRLVALGYANDGIARRLGLSVHTVKNHLRDVCRLLGYGGGSARVLVARWAWEREREVA